MKKLLLSLILVLSAKAATTVVQSSIKESGGLYSSLQAWESALGTTNLVTGDKIYIASIEDAWTNPDTTSFTISGPVTGPNNYLVITNTSSSHLGQINTPSAYKLYVSNPTAGLFMSVQYMRVYGVYVQVHSTAGNNKHPVWLSPAAGGSEYHIRDCYLQTDSANSHYAVNALDTDIEKVYVVGCVLRGMQSGAPSTPVLGLAATNSYVWNNTVYSLASGISRSSGTVSVYNNLVYASGGSDFNGISSGGDYNISSDATSTGGAHDLVSRTITFTDAANGDYTTKDFQVVGRGTTDPGAGWYSTDTKGVTRVAPWDVGAFEYSAGPYRIRPLTH